MTAQRAGGNDFLSRLPKLEGADADLEVFEKSLKYTCLGTRVDDRPLLGHRIAGMATGEAKKVFDRMSVADLSSTDSADKIVAALEAAGFQRRGKKALPSFIKQYFSLRMRSSEPSTVPPTTSR